MPSGQQSMPFYRINLLVEEMPSVTIYLQNEVTSDAYTLWSIFCLFLHAN